MRGRVGDQHSFVFEFSAQICEHLAFFLVSFEGPVLFSERHRTVLALVFAVEFCTNAVAGVMTELSRDAEACTASPAVLSPFQCSQCVDHDQVLFVDLCEIVSSSVISHCCVQR